MSDMLMKSLRIYVLAGFALAAIAAAPVAGMCQESAPVTVPAPENATASINTTVPANATIPVNATLPATALVSVNVTVPEHVTVPVNVTAAREPQVESSRKDLFDAKADLAKLQQDYDQAVFSSSVEKQKLYLELGAVYLKAKMFEASIKSYEEVLKLNPDNAQAHYALGLLCKQQTNDRAKAIEHLKRYLAINPAAKNREDVEYMIKMFDSR
jgi:tetratricopeptide (TPR) repeat protein